MQQRILLIDDEKLIRIALIHSLQEDGYMVDSASSGLEAIEKLSLNRYDLIITDLRLPDISGVEILRVAKKISPEMKVIAMTAYETEQKTEQNIRGMKGELLYKPFTLGTIKGSVSRILQK
ncbi:MAG: response regulator [Acidobacteriota bacterium]